MFSVLGPHTHYSEQRQVAYFQTKKKHSALSVRGGHTDLKNYKYEIHQFYIVS